MNKQLKGILGVREKNNRDLSKLHCEKLYNSHYSTNTAMFIKERGETDTQNAASIAMRKAKSRNL